MSEQSQLIQLEAENQRLRDLLVDYGIDPEPAPVEPPQFGPPTHIEYLMQRTVERAAGKIVEGLLNSSPLLRWLQGEEWDDKQRAELRVKLPAEFRINSVR